MFCSNCGVKLNENEKFCHNCGKPVQNESSLSKKTVDENVEDNSIDKPIKKNPVEMQSNHSFGTKTFGSNSSKNGNSNSFGNNIDKNDNSNSFGSNIDKNDNSNSFGSNIDKNDNSNSFGSNIDKNDNSNSFGSNIGKNNDSNPFYNKNTTPSNVPKIITIFFIGTIVCLLYAFIKLMAESGMRTRKPDIAVLSFAISSIVASIFGLGYDNVKKKSIINIVLDIITIIINFI